MAESGEFRNTNLPGPTVDIPSSRGLGHGFQLYVLDFQVFSEDSSLSFRILGSWFLPTVIGDNCFEDIRTFLQLRAMKHKKIIRTRASRVSLERGMVGTRQTNL